MSWEKSVTDILRLTTFTDISGFSKFTAEHFEISPWSKPQKVSHILIESQSNPLPILVAARSNAWVCRRSLPGIAGSNPTGSTDVFLVRVVCCLVDVSVSGWSLVQRNPTECGVSVCDREASIMKRHWPPRGCRAMKNKTNRFRNPRSKLQRDGNHAFLLI